MEKPRGRRKKPLRRSHRLDRRYRILDSFKIPSL